MNASLPQVTFMRTTLQRCGWLLLLVVSASSALANPSDKQPQAALDVHGQQFSPELLDVAQKLADKNRTALEKFDGLVKANKALKIDGVELGTAYVNSLRLRRAADQLIMLGEPAGVDFGFRAGEQSQAAQRYVLTLKAVPQAAQGVGLMRSKASQVAQLRQKQLPKLQKLIERQDWDTAERELHEVLDEIEVFAIFMQADERVSIFAPWQDASRAIALALETNRKAAALKAFDDRIAATKPDLAKLLADVSAAASSLKKADKHAIADKMLTGPELVAHFDAAWQKAQVAAIKTLALEWARSTRTDTAPTASWTQWRADYDKFAASFGPALKALISADAARVSAADAPALYQAYLPAVADLVDHSAGALASTLQPALDELVAKSPELTANVKAYRAITDDLLRWRERIAAEQAQAIAKDFHAAEAKTHAAFQRSGDSTGFFEAEPMKTAKARLTETAAKTLLTGSPKLVGQKIVIADVCALGGASQAGIARFHDRLYARTTLPTAALTEEVAALETQLMVTPVQPPLSLLATRAVRGARRGDLVQCGGAVSGIFLEGHVTRFATLPDAAATLVALGQLPADYVERDQLEQVALRLDVQPSWVQQRYLFFKLPAP
jgi:hypothetical protein